MARRVSYRGSGGFSLGPIGFLIVVNIMMYAATSIRPELFIDLFGLSRLDFPAQWWTIVTNLFIHDPFPGIWHIIANMLTLYFFGSYLTRLVSSTSFFIVYFLGGLLGNAVYLWLGPLYSIAIGASGAIFAVAGALTVLRPRLTVFIIPIPVPIPLFVAVLGGFLLLSFMPGVAWQAHLGGLVLGLVAGYIFRRRQRRFY